MKKIINTLFLLVSFFALACPKKNSPNTNNLNPSSLFCDVCGCAANGGSMGFGSLLDSNFIGLRYLSQSYSSKDGIFDNSPWMDENFNTVQVWARFPVTEKIQISGLFPYHFNERKRLNSTENIAGLGDITIMGLYSIYETKKDSTIFTHEWNAGVGLKIPTGKFDAANNSGVINQSFQLGTGSWDYQLISEYIIQKEKLGLSSMLNYVFKTENNKKYQYGNQLNYASSLFYVFESKYETKIAPQLGLAGEVYQSNKQFGEVVPHTSGDILFGKLGLEAGKNQFTFGLNAMIPIHQNLSNGKMDAHYRWSINLNYTL